MIKLLSFLIQAIFSLFKPDLKLCIENMLLKKENEILKRKLFSQKDRIIISKFEKVFFVILNLISNIKDKISICTPGTLLKWQNMLVAHFWTFLKKNNTHSGRPPVPAEVKSLILSMKNDNLLWGAKRIRDELHKLDIYLHKKTIQNILSDFRRKGKIKKSYTWKKFLSAHVESLFAMDYFAVDSLLHQRFYVLFIITHKTREIVQIAITQNPVKEFVKQQIISFSESILESAKNSVYLIHDHDSSFMYVDYSIYGIEGVPTSIQAPNMNAIAERFVRSIRNEALDNFILINQKQISKIITSYVEYYNSMRPHQGINSIPRGKPPDEGTSDFSTKNIISKPILGGLHHHYFRKYAWK